MIFVVSRRLTLGERCMQIDADVVLIYQSLVNYSSLFVLSLEDNYDLRQTWFLLQHILYLSCIAFTIYYFVLHVFSRGMTRNRFTS